MNPHRRRLLKRWTDASLAAGALGLLRPYATWAFTRPAGSSPEHAQVASGTTASASSRPNVILVFLRGAADTLNMLVPYNDSAYYEKRPTLGIPRAQCLPLTTEFGVHPALKDSFHALYRANQAVFVPMAGQKDTTRSHFESQANFEGGVGTVHRESGFLGRLTEVLGCSSVSFTENLPTVFASPRVIVPNRTFNPINVQLSPQEVHDLTLAYRQDDPRLAAMFELGQLARVDLPDSADGSPGDGPELQMGKIARYMRDNGATLGFMEILNWDTHAHEGALTHGKLPDRLATLNAELNAFRQAATPTQWANTLIVVATEFGRKVQENGTGTDHGHGGLLSFFGGAVTRARIAGDWLPLTDANLFENRDVQVRHEYRQVLGGVFTKLYGLSAAQLDHVFPGRPPVDLGIV